MTRQLNSKTLVKSLLLMFACVSIVSAQPCNYDLAGDTNDDCVTDIVDFSLVTQTWLIDCNSLPLDPACVPAVSPCASANICEACETDEDCLEVGARCLTLNDGSYCSRACIDNNDCPAGYSCIDTGGELQCVPDTGSCTCTASNLTELQSCEMSYSANPEYSYTCHGIQQCTSSGWSECFLSEEICDYFDNNCDGQVDEDFVAGLGRYVTQEHCGACGNDCSLIYLGPNTEGICNASVDPPICSISCVNNCFDVNANPADGCECCDPTPFDYPDSLGLDSNCDGIDGEIGNAIFVSRTTGFDGHDGSLSNPKRTIQAGIDAAVAQGKRDVFVAGGFYREQIVLATGVGVHGGYASDFTGYRDIIYNETIIEADVGALIQPGVVNAINITGPSASTRLSGFTILGYNINTPSESSYGIYIKDCDDSVSVTDNLIIAGNGGDGTPGSNGLNGLDGQNGTNGIDALDLWDTYGVVDDDCTGAHHSPGGTGGNGFCDGRTNLSGGDGGDSVCPAWNSINAKTEPPSASEAGQNGTNGGGAGGSSGWDVYQLNYNCEGYTVYGDAEGENGLDGQDGLDGSSGTGCVSSGMPFNNLWLNCAATPGADGDFGLGGGGAGAGAGAYAHSSCFSRGFNYGNMGGTGGGGGGGACGGFGGDGGSSGGSSFGIFMTYNITPATVPLISNNRIEGGTGGQGGRGGVGGLGGSSGQGGTGGAGSNYFAGTPELNYPSFPGGNGGNGGNGGHGGGGGGGAGGDAYGIYADNTGPANLSDYTISNLLIPGTGGSGGGGGFSLGNPGTDGTDGLTNHTNF